MASAGAGGGAGAGGSGGDGGIDISTVPIQQLEMMEKQIDQNVKVLTRNYTDLRLAMRRFQMSKEAVEGITPSSAGKDMLVPLTDSLYVPGRLAETKTVLVDIGTGYHVSKTPGQAQDFLDKKIAFVKKQADTVEGHINAKRRDLNAVREALQLKMKMAAESS